MASAIENYLIDMDEGLVREEQAIPGADRVHPRAPGGRAPVPDPDQQLGVHAARPGGAARTSGLHVPADSIWTAALAVARFLDEQRPGGRAYVIGEAGLTTALHEAGYMLADRDPDYVVLGETRSYSIERITRGDPPDRRRRPVHRRQSGRHRPVGGRLQPATGAVAALISKATGVEPYFVGKPNPLMMREALRRSAPTPSHGDGGRPHGHRRRAGIEAGLRTILVLTGVTTPNMIDRFPYRPSRTVDSVADLVAEIESSGSVDAVLGEAAESSTPELAAPARPMLDGNEIPLLGFGTWPLDDAEAFVAVGAALRVG